MDTVNAAAQRTDVVNLSTIEPAKTQLKVVKNNKSSKGSKSKSAKLPPHSRKRTRRLPSTTQARLEYAKELLANRPTITFEELHAEVKSKYQKGISFHLVRKLMKAARQKSKTRNLLELLEQRVSALPEVSKANLRTLMFPNTTARSEAARAKLAGTPLKSELSKLEARFKAEGFTEVSWSAKGGWTGKKTVTTLTHVKL